jgi:4-nitrophenyl phosphatase
MTMKTLPFDPSDIRALILDMDGVLWRDMQPVGDLPVIFKEIRNLGLRVILATNNATKSPKQFLEKLAGFGVTLEAWQIINSAIATAAYLKKMFPQGGHVFVVGNDGLILALQEQGFQLNEKDAIAVIAALDRELTYEKLKIATLLIRSGVPFIGTNPDRSFPIPGGEAPGAGAILAAIEAATDVKPTIIGKPRPDMYQAAIERLGTSAEETLVVGDRLETDIAGAQNGGFPNALVLSGVTTLDQAKAWRPAPDLITDDLESLLELF